MEFSKSNQILLKEVLTQTIASQSYEHYITFTPYGEVLSISNDFQNLPEDAQRITAGQDFDQIKLALKTEQQLLKYFVPLAALNYLKKEKWKPLQQKIAEVMNKGLLDRDHKRYGDIENNWVREVHKFHDRSPNQQFLPSLAKVIEEEGYEQESALKELAQYPNFLGGPILKVMRPTFKEWSIVNEYYACLRDYQSEENYKLLSTKLKEKDQRNFHEGIIIGLSGYQYPNLHELLWNYMSKMILQTIRLKSIY